MQIAMVPKKVNSWQQENVTAARVAEIFGISIRRVQQLAKENGMPRNARNSYPLVDCAAWYISYLQSRLDENSSDSLLAEKIKVQARRAEKLEIEVNNMRGNTLSLEQAEQETITILSKCKEHILALPGQMAHVLEGKGKSEIHESLNLQVKKICRQLSEDLKKLCHS